MTNIEPKQLQEVLGEIPEQSMAPKYTTGIAIHLFSHAVGKHDSPTVELQFNELDDELNDYREELREMESVGWITQSSETVTLTPTGVSIAGPEYSNLFFRTQ